MRRVLLVPVLCLALLAGPVWAQDVPPSTTPALSSLDLALWPEYDRPEVLVIHSGLLTPETSLRRSNLARSDRPALGGRLGG
jgi:hypothetical protein